MWGFDLDSGWLWVYGVVAMGSLVVVIIWSVRALRHGDGLSPVDPRPDTAQQGGSQPGSPQGGAASDARSALDDRLARGEISPEQYRDQLRNLGEEP